MGDATDPGSLHHIHKQIDLEDSTPAEPKFFQIKSFKLNCFFILKVQR